MSSINGGFSGGGFKLKKGSIIDGVQNNYGIKQIGVSFAAGIWEDVITFNGRFAISRLYGTSVSGMPSIDFRFVDLSGNVLFEFARGGSTSQFVNLYNSSSNDYIIDSFIIENAIFQLKGDNSGSGSFTLNLVEIE